MGSTAPLSIASCTLPAAGAAQGAQEPPQSTAVSSPSLMLFWHVLAQQTSVPTGRWKAGPLPEPQTRPVWHWSGLSQSPSPTLQGQSMLHLLLAPLGWLQEGPQSQPHWPPQSIEVSPASLTPL